MSELTRRELLVRSAGGAGAAWLGGVLPGLDLLAEGSAEAARESGPLAGIAADRRATRVEIGGFDRHEPPLGSSSPGAGWTFTLDELSDAGAFLATGMNGAALPVDHGRPVRLVVPNWFGCCSPKWVDRIRFVDDSAPATSQMREFAGRTHQDGVPELAREYAPARIQVQAMPVRVERWRLPEGELRYRVLGIVWGGERPVEELVIRFDPAGADGPPSDAAGWERVDRVDRRALPTWGFWTHVWVPPGGSGPSGHYTVRLQTTERSIPTLRLNLGHYDRTVKIGPP